MVKLENFIADFSKRYQLDNLTADEKGTYTVTFDGDMEVRCFERFGLVYFISVLDILPEKETLAWLKRLLNYALMRVKHSSAAATLDADNRVLLHTRFELGDLKAYEFEEKLERYVNVLEEYRHFLTQASQPIFSAGQMVFKP